MKLDNNFRCRGWNERKCESFVIVSSSFMLSLCCSQDRGIESKWEAVRMWKICLFFDKCCWGGKWNFFRGKCCVSWKYFIAKVFLILNFCYLNQKISAILALDTFYSKTVILKFQAARKWPLEMPYVNFEIIPTDPITRETRW